MSNVIEILSGKAITFRRRPEFFDTNPRPLDVASSFATSPYKFGYARTAFKHGLISSGFQPGDTVLVPEFICESLIEPLVQLEIIPQYYPVDSTLAPAWHKVERLTNQSTKALIVVHYFGQPQNIPECIEFCKTHSLMLIEDNAHGFGGAFEGQLLGTFGDFGISAPRKSFPLINGAYLYIKKEIAPESPGFQLYARSHATKKNRLKSLIKQTPFISQILKYRRRFNEYRIRSAPPVQYGSQNAFRDPCLRQDFAMHEKSEPYLLKQNIDHIRKIRHQIYELWENWTIKQGLKPVFQNLMPGAMPLVFPAYSESASDSIQWFERGHRGGVDIHSWPTLPQSIVDLDGDAMRLWERMVCFPIHQEMDTQLLKRRLHEL